MALATYADLLTQVANWTARDDLTTYIPDFVTLFEAAANRRLRVRQMEATVPLTVTNGQATLPADYLEWRRVTWTGTPSVELEYVHPDYLHAFNPNSDQGTPTIFTIEGSTLSVADLDNTALTLDYYQKIVALSGSVNWLYSTHPDIYLFGALVEAHTFTKNFEEAQIWKARRDELFMEIEKLGRRTSGPAAIRVMGTVV